MEGDGSKAGAFNAVASSSDLLNIPDRHTATSPRPRPPAEFPSIPGLSRRGEREGEREGGSERAQERGRETQEAPLALDARSPFPAAASAHFQYFGQSKLLHERSIDSSMIVV